MAEKEQHEEETKKASEEKEIPVLTVLKNNCILKNIFLPPEHQESEIVVGRHPDCNIKLEHPSISRFHLRIHSSSPSLSVTDLSSVHGTWISGKRIKPGVRMKLNEGDTLRLGASSRLYRLHWVPISRAYDIDNPFMLQLDDGDTLDEETEGAIDQDGNVSYRDDQVQTLSDITEGLQLLFAEEDISSMSLIMPIMPEDLNHSFSHKEETENPGFQLDNGDTVNKETEAAIDQDGNSLSYTDEQVQTLSDITEGLELLFSEEDLSSMSPTTPIMPQDLNHSFSHKEETENNSSPGILNQENEHPCNQLCENSFPLSYSSSAVSQTVSQLESLETSGMNSEKRASTSIWSRRGKTERVQIETKRNRGESARINMNMQVTSLVDDSYKCESILKENCAGPGYDEEIFTPNKENTSPISPLVRSLKITFDGSLKSKSIANSPISSLDQDGEEIFTPDKENMTPKSHLLRSMENIAKLEVKDTKSYRPSPLKTASNSTSHKGIQQRKVFGEWDSTSSASKSHGSLKKQSAVLKARSDRNPFQPLPVTSTYDHRVKPKPSCHEDTMIDSKIISFRESKEHYTKKVEGKRWIIVADTGCLLNKNSRRELQLLQGLRGTTLVIPRIVVRELDCLSRRWSFFTRMTEASDALQWIDKCMTVAKSWIHVQSSAEEVMLIPPTPPAASLCFSEEKGAFCVGSFPFSPYGLQEIATPTASDHILECALFFKRTRNDGQLVLLSDDVTLKIKAMAEGVICETAEEFRRSLVNPFSSRFLYSDSSPIGPTWSCEDDSVLKDKYYPSPSKKLSRSREGGAKGLKLILMHNSSFKQSTPVS